MGMFDTVWVPCPECENELELQSKGGPRLLYNYPAYDVPRDVAADLVEPWYYATDDNKTLKCDYCGTRLYITIVPKLTNTSVLVQLHKVSEKGNSNTYD